MKAVEVIFSTKTLNLHTSKVIKFESFADVPYNHVFNIECSRNRRWFGTQRTPNASIFHHLLCKSFELGVRAYKSKSESKRIFRSMKMKMKSDGVEKRK